MQSNRSILPTWLTWLDSCDSTNRWALDRLDSLPNGTVIFTPNQTAGRGQQGRSWRSPEGVLTASCIVEIPPQRLSTLSLVIGLAVIYAIADLCPNLNDQLQLKWTNDVLISDRKLAGILCETISSQQSPCRVVIGIGLNRHVDFANTELQHKATSLHHWCDRVPDELTLLEKLRHYVLQAASVEFAAVLPAIRSRDVLLGKTIDIEHVGEVTTGESAGISDRGYLLLKLADGEVRSILSGHIVRFG